MSSIQWLQYSITYNKDKLKSIRRIQRGDLYDDKNSDFNIRNRQNCNIIYENDEFRYKDNDVLKKEFMKLW